VLRQHRTLSAIFAFDKALHVAPVVMRYWLNVYRYDFVYTALRFYTGWAGRGHRTAQCMTLLLSEQVRGFVRRSEVQVLPALRLIYAGNNTAAAITTYRSGHVLLVSNLPITARF
jgi:hypothetical protein